MIKKTHYWIKDLSKIKESDWILKLLSINDTDKNLKSLANKNDISEVFISNKLLYKHIITNIDSILEKDPTDLVKELILLREKMSLDKDYLENFKITINESVFRDYYRGVNTADIIFNNYGFINKDKDIQFNSKMDTTEIQLFNNKIVNNLTNKSDFMGTEKQNDSLKQSIKSSTGWPVIDFKKHAVGSMVNFLELTIDIVKNQSNSKKTEKRKSIKFLCDIFGLYNVLEGDIEEYIYSIFYDEIEEFNIPIWKGVDKEVMIQKVKIKEDSDSDSLPNILNKCLNSYKVSSKSGYGETSILILYNLFIIIINRYQRIINTLSQRVNHNNNLELEVILNSIRKSIVSLKDYVNFQFKQFFGLSEIIELMDDKSISPKINYEKGQYNLFFRLIGGYKSIVKKENCSPELFPIVLDISDGKLNIKINKNETMKRLINMFMHKTDISIGGFILNRKLLTKNCLIFRRYLDSLIDSKLNAMKKIDIEFNKIIKNIKLKNIKKISKEIEVLYKKIINERNLLIKKAVFNEVSDDLILKYNEYKIRELYLLKEVIENNKYIKTGDKRNKKTLKELISIQKKLIIEYFSIQNISLSYSLLLENVYKTLQDILSKKGVSVEKQLPNEFITIIMNKVKEIDSKLQSNKQQLNTRELNNLERKIKTSKNVSLNMLGGQGIFNWIQIKDNKLEYDKGKYDKMLKKIIENKKIKDEQKALLIKKLFNSKSVLKKKNKVIKPIKRPLNNLKKEPRLTVNNRVLNIDYWQDLEERLCHKKIFIPYYQPNTLLSNKGFFNLFYAPSEGELNKESKYLVSFSKKEILSKISSSGFIIVCSNSSDLKDSNKWRLLKKSFLKELKSGKASDIRKHIYSLIKSESNYNKNTYSWSSKILNNEKETLKEICKVYHSELNGCQIIISREELLNYI